MASGLETFRNLALRNPDLILHVGCQKGKGWRGGGGLTCVYSELFKAWSGASRRKGGRAQQLRLLGAVV